MLFLKKLKLNNWCNFTTEKIIEFEKGFNVINGKNGSGKSSIVNAISILLLNKYDGNWESFINNNKTEASISLDFNLDNDEYISSLVLTKKGKTVGSSRSLSKNRIDIASGEDCEKELNKILPSFLTSYSLIYRQGEDNKVTECSDSERRDLLTQLVAINYTDKINQFITPNINSINETILQKEKEKFSLENKTYNFGELKDVKEKHSKELIEDLKEKVIQYKKNEQLRTQKFQLENKKINLQNELSELKEEYSIENLNKEKEKEIKFCENQILQLPIEYEKEIISYKETTRETLVNLINAHASINEKIKQIEIKNYIEFDISQLENINNKISSLTTQKNILEKNIKSLEKGICPVCGNNCTHKLEEIKKDLTSILAQLEEFNTQKDLLEKEKNRVNIIKEENEKNKSLKNELQLELQNLENKIEFKKIEIQNHIKELKKERDSKIQTSNEKIVSLKKLYDEKISSANTIISNKEKELENTQKEFDSIIIEDLKDYKPELERLEEENKEIDSIISYNEAIKIQNELTKKQQSEDKNNLENISKKLIDLQTSLSDYKLAFEIMSKTYPTWKLEKDIVDIENKTNLFIENIYKPLYVKFIANKNSLKMLYGKGERELNVKRLSGAEKQIVNLAVENVFNQQQSLSCIILDECDSAMDKNNKETFFDTLLSLSSYYEQILVITHSSEIKDKLQVENSNLIIL